MSSENTNEGNEEADLVRPQWMDISESDIEGVVIEAPIVESDAADCYQLSALYRSAAAQSEEASEANVYSALAEVTHFHFEPHDLNQPFSPMMVTSAGRSAAPEDFLGGLSRGLHSILSTLSHPTLKARVADVCWLLDRSRSDAAEAAIYAYVEIAEQVKAGGLAFTSSKDREFGYRCLGGIRRALAIARATGWEKPAAIAAREYLAALRVSALEQANVPAVRNTSEIDLDFGVSDPAEVARSAEKVLPVGVDEDDLNLRNYNWKLIARGFRVAKLEDDANRCLVAAAECLVELAGREGAPAMFSAHWLQAAISELQRVPGTRERKTELRHKLIDIQARISDEMSPFEHQTDISEIIACTDQRFDDLNLPEKLGVFASLRESPKMEGLRKSAVEAISRHPLSSLFSTSKLDHEGKTVHRSSGGGRMGRPNEDAIENQISQSESIRRGLVATGEIEVARRRISDEHFLCEAHMFLICANSPFVPPDHRMTFSKGFLNFFQGDFYAALYILVPQLENSFRHVLKAHGHDVTKFNSRDETQEDRTISSLYEQMRAEIDAIFGQNLSADVERVFLSRSGPYLRHRLAHGVLNDFDPMGSDAIYACWLIFHICCLPLFPYWDRLEKEFSRLFGGE